MSKETVGTLVRTVLKVGAGYLAAKGLADEATSEIVISGVIAAIGIVWGIVAKKPAAPAA